MLIRTRTYISCITIRRYVRLHVRHDISCVIILFHDEMTHIIIIIETYIAMPVAATLSQLLSGSERKQVRYFFFLQTFLSYIQSYSFTQYSRRPETECTHTHRSLYALHVVILRRELFFARAYERSRPTARISTYRDNAYDIIIIARPRDTICCRPSWSSSRNTRTHARSTNTPENVIT